MERRRRRLRAGFDIVVLVCLLNLTTGCFVPQPVEEAPAPGADVQVRLTEPAQARISVQAGRAVEAVAGRVIRIDADSLIVAVRWGEIAGGSSGRPGPDVVRLAQSEIDDLMRPRFSLSRTLALGVVVAASIVLLASGALGIGGGTPDEQEPTGDDLPDNN